MVSTLLHAQKPFNYYPSALPVYPKFTDLFSGLISNSTNMTIYVNLKYTLSNADATTTITDSLTGIIIKPGINPFTSDTFISVLFKNGNLPDTSYLDPGGYSFTMQLIHEAEQFKYSNNVHVPPYSLKINYLAKDTLSILIEPPVNNIQIYVCRTQLTSLGKRNTKTNCYSAGKTLTKSNYSKDSSGDYRYKIEAYKNARLIASSSYHKWEDLSTHTISHANGNKTRPTSNYKQVQLSVWCAAEYGYTNSRYTNQLSATQYARFHFKPTLTVQGIPITFNTSLTTENNTNYPLNFFQVGFDANKFAADFANNALKDRLSIEQRIENNKLELVEVNRELKVLNNYKAQKAKHSDKITNHQTDTTNQSLKNSIKEGYEKRSLKRFDEKSTQLNLKKSALEIDLYNDSLYLSNRHVKDLPEDTIKRMLRGYPQKKLLKTLLAVRAFNLGFCAPFYSDLTLSQMPLQGIHVDLRYPRWLISATAGNRIKAPEPLLSRELVKPKFENKTYACKFGLIEPRGNTTLSLSYFHLKSGTEQPLFKSAENNIFSVMLESRFLERFNLKTEMAKSFYQPYFSGEKTNDKHGVLNSWDKNFDNLAFNSLLEITATKNTEFILTFKKIDNGYFSLGIPFLRNDYIEYTTTWKQFWWRKQLETELSYMLNRDNLINNKTHTTILTGYGATFKTHLRSKPNFLVIYKPFNSSFSFEETLFNPSNIQQNIITQQFYIFHTTVFYTKNFSNKNERNSIVNHCQNGRFSVSYNRSNNQNSNGSFYKLETVTGSCSLSDNSNRTFLYNVSLYQSTVGINNAMLHDINYSTTALKKRVRITTGSIGQFINDKRKRVGIYSQASCSFMSCNLSVRVSSNYLEGVWFVGNNKFENTVNIILEWRF